MRTLVGMAQRGVGAAAAGWAALAGGGRGNGLHNKKRFTTLGKGTEDRWQSTLLWEESWRMENDPGVLLDRLRRLEREILYTPLCRPIAGKRAT